jgi:GAF domain-containing protein
VIPQWEVVLDTTQKFPARMKMERVPKQFLPLENPAPDLPPVGEEERQATDKAFDDLAGLASHVCEAPFGCISLMEASKQWYKASGDLSETEQQRDVAFCRDALLSEELLHVPDLAGDKRFEKNSLVHQEPKIRFFAGTPLISATGEMLGTLCVVDSKPRRLTQEQREAFQTLSRQVVGQLELRRRINSLVNNHTVSDLSAPGIARELLSSNYKGGDKLKVDRRSMVVLRGLEQTGHGASSNGNGHAALAPDSSH